MSEENAKEELDDGKIKTGESSEVKSRFPYQAAKFSLFAPIVAIVMNLLAKNTAPPTPFIIACMAIVIYPIALCLGIVALCFIKKYGKKGILVRSIIGILFNSVIILIAIISIPAMNTARQYSQKVNRYQFKPPTGFFENKQIAQSLSNALDAYVKTNPNDNTSDIILIIEDMQGTLSKDEDLTSFLKDKPNIKLLNHKWKNHDVSVYRIEEKVGNVATLTYNAQIPVIPAIQIKLMGLEARDQELKDILKNAINGVSGKSNWD